MSLRGDSLRTKEVDLTNLLGDSIDEITWANDSERVLVKTNGEWVLVDLSNPKNSLKLNATYAGEDKGFSKVVFANSAGDRLWAQRDDKVYAIHATSGDKKLQLVREKVENFVADEQELMYVSTDKGHDKEQRAVYLFSVGNDEEAYCLQDIEGDSPVYLALTSFADEKVMAVAQGNQLQVYEASDYPASTSGDWGGKLTVTKELSFNPKGNASISRNKEFVVFRENNKLALLDVELMEVYEYDYNGGELQWADDFMLALTEGEKLTVMDFDGTNVRELVSSAVSGFGATITSNNRWLYYVVDNQNSGLSLMRERLN